MPPPLLPPLLLPLLLLLLMILLAPPRCHASMPSSRARDPSSPGGRPAIAPPPLALLPERRLSNTLAVPGRTTTRPLCSHAAAAPSPLPPCQENRNQAAGGSSRRQHQHSCWSSRPRQAGPTATAGRQPGLSACWLACPPSPLPACLLPPPSRPPPRPPPACLSSLRLPRCRPAWAPPCCSPPTYTPRPRLPSPPGTSPWPRAVGGSPRTGSRGRSLAPAGLGGWAGSCARPHRAGPRCRGPAGRRPVGRGCGGLCRTARHRRACAAPSGWRWAGRRWARGWRPGLRAGVAGKQRGDWRVKAAAGAAAAPSQFKLCCR